MLTSFTYSIHYITPSQTKNEIDFSLAGIYTASNRDNLSVEMLSDLIFINRKITASGHNTPIYVFVGSIDYMADIVDGMESNPDAFAYASDTE